MTARVDLPLSGMTCAAWAGTIEGKLSKTPGVTHVKVDLGRPAADVEYERDLVAPHVPVRAVQDLGWEVSV